MQQLPSGATLQNEKYKIEKVLEQGGFGITYLAENIAFEEKVCIKEFFMKGVNEREEHTSTVSISNANNKQIFAEQKDKFKKEARRLRILHSEHIVQVHDLFEENGTAYYVMDYIEGENLAERLKHTGYLSESEVKEILSQVLEALSKAHHEGILHLDLKPANIMVNKRGIAKLIDFGASKQQSGTGGATTSTAVSYTNGFAPREQMEQNLDKFGPWTDFYALGATLYNLLTNKKPPMPLDIDDDGSTDKHIALPLLENVSNKTRRLILWMMSTNKLTRPNSVNDIRAYLSDNEHENCNHTEIIDSTNDLTTTSKQADGETLLGSSQSNSEIQHQTNTDENGEYLEAAGQKKKWMAIFSVAVCLIFAFVYVVPNESLNNSIVSSSPENTSTNSESGKKDSTHYVKSKKITVGLGSCIYTGYVENNSPNGKGEAWFDDGRYYKGSFSNGIMDDKNAFFRYPNGDTFQGVLEGDHFSKGRYTINQDKSYLLVYLTAKDNP